MVEQKVYGFNEAGYKRVREATRRVMGSPRTGSQRRRQPPIIGGGGGCEDRNEIWQVVIFGAPTGGTFDIGLNILGTTEALTFNWDDDATEVETELETHTNIASGDVEVTGGAFPSAAINIEFMGDLANHRFPVPTVDFGSLTGGTGVGVIVARYQPGHPKQGHVAPESP